MSPAPPRINGAQAQGDRHGCRRVAPGWRVLFVNAATLPSKTEPRSVCISNLFVGVLPVAGPFCVVATVE